MLCVFKKDRDGQARQLQGLARCRPAAAGRVLWGLGCFCSRTHKTISCWPESIMFLLADPPWVVDCLVFSCLSPDLLTDHGWAKRKQGKCSLAGVGGINRRGRILVDRICKWVCTWAGHCMHSQSVCEVGIGSLYIKIMHSGACGYSSCASLWQCRQLWSEFAAFQHATACHVMVV